jgi:hypothetical protein
MVTARAPYAARRLSAALAVGLLTVFGAVLSAGPANAATSAHRHPAVSAASVRVAAAAAEHGTKAPASGLAVSRHAHLSRHATGDGSAVAATDRFAAPPASTYTTRPPHCLLHSASRTTSAPRAPPAPVAS